MRETEGIVGDKVDRIKVDHATQQTEHEEVNHPELQDGAEEGETSVTEVPYHRMDSKENGYQGEGEDNLGFGKITHRKGEPVRGDRTIS